MFTIHGSGILSGQRIPGPENVTNYQAKTFTKTRPTNLEIVEGEVGLLKVRWVTNKVFTLRFHVDQLITTNVNKCRPTFNGSIYDPEIRWKSHRCRIPGPILVELSCILSQLLRDIFTVWGLGLSKKLPES